MRLTILTFVFIVLYHVSVAQISLANSNLQNSNNCPLMEVSINSNNNNGIVEVSYCNHGNTTAVGAYVEIEVTNELLITQATIPVYSVVGKKYTFHLGNVNSSECAAFYIEIPNSEKKIHCTNVHIYPDNPCQGMINQFIINNAGNNSDNGVGNGNNNDDTNDTNINTAVTTTAANMQYSAPGPPVLGQGSSSVFEDHVFLDNIPTWDSLLSVLTTSGVQPNLVISNNGAGTASTINDLNDITTLFSAELCSNNNQGGGPIILDIHSQTTSLAIGDKTVYGTTPNTTVSAVTTEVKDYTKEDKEVVVHLFPNPFSTTATITIDGADYQQTTLEILDLAGKTIQSLQVNKQQSITLHRENLSQGVYLYRLIGDDIAIHTGKFVVR
ncbi:T9SS type A sorting domain-containing protein [Aureispira sp. CCB-E]|uniref:T9SS type A sorting domain-containing protein n=1 Tax=Aureispira sp. CCB-E TaxID=3051121 RepID=UPI00286863A9|nr:T9SS type A sorting domain-containing protein [Aureispira sp. CCB-E]WMX14932.1 T9SS type A sorting domain-containing protein [Aureispira sp. CCB-E]